MVTLQPENITVEDYLNTDIESLCLRFVYSNESALVDEYEVPDSYKYNVFTYTREGETVPDFIEIANYEWMKNVIYEDEKCLPDIRFNFEDEKGITLIDFIKKYIFEDIPDDDWIT